MKAIHIESGLLATTLALFFFVSGKVASDNPASSLATSMSHTVSFDASHPLAMAHQQLEQAGGNYQKGDILKFYNTTRNVLPGDREYYLYFKITHIHSGLGMDTSGCGYISLSVLRCDEPK